MLAPRYCRVMITSVMPWRRSSRSTCSMQGRPTTGTSGLGRRLVIGRSRVPPPPLLTTALMRGCPDPPCISRPAQLSPSPPRSYGEAALPTGQVPEQKRHQKRCQKGHHRRPDQLHGLARGAVDRRGGGGGAPLPGSTPPP